MSCIIDVLVLRFFFLACWPGYSFSPSLRSKQSPSRANERQGIWRHHQMPEVDVTCVQQPLKSCWMSTSRRPLCNFLSPTERPNMCKASGFILEWSGVSWFGHRGWRADYEHSPCEAPTPHTSVCPRGKFALRQPPQLPSPPDCFPASSPSHGVHQPGTGAEAAAGAPEGPPQGAAASD